ncbi:AGE family epimerase/isomerase [Bacteroides sp. OttesenSCG-928-E20]|nr:AGE family epimerase/isomerase [Bacteroides sp. OttesenSCG-928-N06]MDL2299528.1 AGE family epimerase/isomerase [Bacteroides sp. OttesenSCG-928-E20]MDL2304813.1 AGE family epimerase/isomerase [Bacteroides sp. OttesenSCG-928-D19]
MQTLRKELHNELVGNILPYWMQNVVDRENGGFYGRIDGHEQLHPQANKGVVLNARILWTFAAAYRTEKNPQYLETAERAYNYIKEYFIDKEHGGVYWELDYTGRPVNTRKQIYAQGFALYGFTEYYRATGHPEALELSKEFFHLIEKHAYDPAHGGYIEALARDWTPLDDMRLSPRDANAPKSMNTHLHILEPYTNLLRIWQEPVVMDCQRRLIETFVKYIVDNRTKHLILFFDKEWNPDAGIISYGHDIEASWLLYEAAEVLADQALLESIKRLAVDIAEASYQGLQPDGSMAYETANHHTDTDRHWWVQAETVVGSVYAYSLTGDEKYLNVARRCWEYIKNCILDAENGEWVWSAYTNGTPNREDDKAGPWKCPYHNARMCMEIIIKS